VDCGVLGLDEWRWGRGGWTWAEAGVDTTGGGLEGIDDGVARGDGEGVGRERHGGLK
jgi:hypothetical protein